MKRLARCAVCVGYAGSRRVAFEFFQSADAGRRSNLVVGASGRDHRRRTARLDGNEAMSAASRRGWSGSSGHRRAVRHDRLDGAGRVRASLRHLDTAVIMPSMFDRVAGAAATSSALSLVRFRR